MKYYISYASKDMWWGEKHKAGVGLGHAMILLSSFNDEDLSQFNNEKWTLHQAIGLNGRGWGSCNLIWGYINGRTYNGYLGNEFSSIDDTELYIRNFEVEKEKYDCAVSLLNEDRQINVETLYDDDGSIRKVYKGPNFNSRQFNCHKYAVKFLVRMGIVDNYLLQRDYPSQFNFEPEMDPAKFQYVKINEGKIIDLTKQETVPFSNIPETFNYPSSYHRIASRIYPSLGRASTSMARTNLSIEGQRLYSLGIAIMKDYSSVPKRVFAHWGRHHSGHAHSLVAELNRYKMCGSIDAFIRTINVYLGKLPSKVINPSGSFFRRLLFLREIGQKMAG
ncbi:MAG: hypothetical protein GY750_19845 [Lentisphaerae bacterium]|nr:hypothetical protein [Lentisphaerota bacterium]MCP4103648.1 hypothetical protein [Lentisphaerota bacterium]